VRVNCSSTSLWGAEYRILKPDPTELFGVRKDKVFMNSQASTLNYDYALGYTNAEHDRLIRQAARIAPITERLFREAGVGPGQRVLDLGSGVGDVSMLLARLVGPSGEVVGVERDAGSIARAKARVAEAGLRNVAFTQTDVNQVVNDQPFDAAVGRFILMFLPDPISVLRSLFKLLRPGGVLVFQEVSWIPFLAFSARLPLWSKVLSSIHEILLRFEVNPETGPALYHMFQAAGFPAPAMHMETPLGSDADFTRVMCDVLGSLRPLAQQHRFSFEGLGDFNTLPERIQAEVAGSKGVVSWVSLVGAWSHKPNSGQTRQQQHGSCTGEKKESRVAQ
jgi:ubiquinone/menaquinone biosynthesis C-methylase UbiE